MLSPAAAAIAPAHDLLRDMLAVSLTGIIFYTPIYDPAGTGQIIDFTFEYLNPTAQRMMSMPEVPVVTHNQQWPHSIAHGTFQFHVEAFESGEPREYNVNYQADGYDNYYRLAARRSGLGLLVSFTDTADQPRSSVEVALREAQAAEKAARADAETQRQRLYQVLMNLPAKVATYHGPEHVYTLVNQRYQNYFPTHTLLGRPVREAVPEAAEQGFFACLDQVYTTGEPAYRQELPVYLDFAGTGHPREPMYINAFYLPLRDADGHVDGVLDFSYNVTEQVVARRQTEQLNQELETRVQARTQEALALQADLLTAAQRQAQEREQFYQIFAQTPAAICVQRGPAHRYEYANQAYQDFFPGRQFLGRTVAEALPETVDSGVVDLLDHVYQTGETYYGEELPLLIAQPEGPPKQMYFTFTYQAYRENGKIVGISTFAYDVAERVGARQRLEAYAGELQESEARFRTMADAAPNMVWAVHPDSTVRYINRAFLDFVGLDNEQQYIATGWGPYLHPEEWELTQRTLSRAIAQREPYVLEHRMRRSDGHYRWLLAQGAPSYLAGGELYGYVGSAIDITELKQANEQLTRTNVDLDNFIYTASHDLKAPISNIEGLLYLLQEELPSAGAEDSEIGPILNRMLEAVERFKRTIHHLTEVSKLQKEHAPATTLVDLASVIEGVRQDLTPLLQATGARIAVDVAALPPVQFSEKNLRSVVYNLLSNALKYHSPDRTPHIDVRGHVRAGHTVLEVHDNGLGMAKSQLAKLYGMFQRFHDHVEGTGIGLYMVKRMVDNAGGRIEAHSQLGAGTTFFVYLPHATSATGAAFPAILPS